METNIKDYINFLEWKESTIIKYIFNPRVDNALSNWIHNNIRVKKISNHDYDYKNSEHKRISQESWDETNKIMMSMESIIDYLSSNKINPRRFKWFWEKSYQEFLEKLNSLTP